MQYNIAVRAYTSQGPGPFSVPILDSSLNSEYYYGFILYK